MSDVAGAAELPVANPVPSQMADVEASAATKTTEPTESTKSDETEQSDASTQTGDLEAGPEASPQPPVVFSGSTNNMVPGVALLFAAVLAFTMGMTDVFFAEATAWTFAIWGVLLIYGGVIDTTRTFTVKEDALVIANPARPFTITQTWDWAYVQRMDLLVKRRGARPQDLELRVYFAPPGELAVLREDRAYDAELAELIVERAGLKPSDSSNPPDLHKIPLNEKVTYTWTR